jgi:hypothetical protein
MNLVEDGYLSHQELNINWTLPFKYDNKHNNSEININGKTSNQQNVEKSSE